ETDETVIKRNGWGALHRYWKHKSGTPEHIGFDMTGPEIWHEKYRDRLLGFNPRRLNDIEQLKINFRKCAESDKWTCYHGLLPVEIMRQSMGDVVMLESLYLNPDWIQDFCDVVTDMLITHYEYLLNEIGIPDGMFFYEDMGYTYGPIMSPDSYRELIAPYHKRFFDWVHSHGMPIVMHSCGKIRPFLQTIFETGADCLQVLEAKAGQHVVEMANFVDNKMAFMGNLNIVAIESNDRKTIDAEILPKLDAIRKNRIPYVFHSDHSIPKTVNLDTYRYVLELFKKYGYY
ncbi:MAG: uroporphyrinogen decarboxylase family protein, partial [bacterium]